MDKCKSSGCLKPTEFNEELEDYCPECIDKIAEDYEKFSLTEKRKQESNSI